MTDYTRASDDETVIVSSTQSEVNEVSIATHSTIAQSVTKPYKGDDLGPVPLDHDLQAKQLAAHAFSRQARDRFVDACNAPTTVESENHFYAVRDALETLWDYVAVRDPAFKELLGLIEAAVRGNELESLNEAQRDVIDQALHHLCRPFFDEDDVDNFNRQFAERQIDICGPIRANVDRVFRVTIEEING